MICSACGIDKKHRDYECDNNGCNAAMCSAQCSIRHREICPITHPELAAVVTREKQIQVAQAAVVPLGLFSLGTTAARQPDTYEDRRVKAFNWDRAFDLNYFDKFFEQWPSR